MEINNNLRQYFESNISELIELMNENDDNRNLRHLHYSVNDEDFLEYYFNNDSILDIIKTILRKDNINSINITDEYIKHLGDGKFKTLSKEEYKDLLLENLDYIMSYIDSEDLSSKALEAYNKCHVMWCNECKELIDSVSCITLARVENTLSLDYDFDNDDDTSVNDLDNENEIERYGTILYCDNCGTKLNKEQREYILKVCGDSGVDIDIEL